MLYGEVQPWTWNRMIVKGHLHMWMPCVWFNPDAQYADSHGLHVQKQRKRKQFTRVGIHINYEDLFFFCFLSARHVMLEIFGSVQFQ